MCKPRQSDSVSLSSVPRNAPLFGVQDFALFRPTIFRLGQDAEIRNREV